MCELLQQQQQKSRPLRSINNAFSLSPDAAELPLPPLRSKFSTDDESDNAVFFSFQTGKADKEKDLVGSKSAVKMGLVGSGGSSKPGIIIGGIGKKPLGISIKVSSKTLPDIDPETESSNTEH